jgi:hypothetical protein
MGCKQFFPNFVKVVEPSRWDCKVFAASVGVNVVVGGVESEWGWKVVRGSDVGITAATETGRERKVMVFYWVCPFLCLSPHSSSFSLAA